MVGYLCAYFRHYHPLEFITSYLNNVTSEEDIRRATLYAKKIGIDVTLPKWGVSRSNYYFDREYNIISKGLASVKYIGLPVANALYEIAKSKKPKCFVELLWILTNETALDTRQLDILIHIDFFSQFGNQRELLKIVDAFNLFKQGNARQIKKETIDGTELEPIVKKYAVGVTKSGGEAKSYTLLDVMAILKEAEQMILAAGLPDLDDIVKVNSFQDALGYVGYVSNKPEDRQKLYITDIRQLVHNDRLWAYSVFTKSIGSGVESRFTVRSNIYRNAPIDKGDIILCQGYERTYGKDGHRYFNMTRYVHIYKKTA